MVVTMTDPIRRGSPPEDPTPEMRARGAAILSQNEGSDPEVRAHDVWQAMYDEWLSGDVAQP